MNPSFKYARWISTVCACAVLVAGAAFPASAAPKGKPGVTPPGVPPGQPFQALQKQIDALAGRVKALEAAAPKAGVMWIDPLSLSLPGTSLGTTSLDPVATGAQQGLAITGAAVGTDVVQVGLQVPLGFAVTGVTVCYLSGANGSSVNNAQLVQFAVPPALPPAVPLTQALAAPGTNVTSCVETTTAVSVDPSAGGPVYLSLGLNFTAIETIVIRGVGLQLEPSAAP